MHPFSTQRGPNTIPNLAPALRCHSIVSPGLYMSAILVYGLVTLTPSGRTAMLLIRQHTHSFHLESRCALVQEDLREMSMEQ